MTVLGCSRAKNVVQNGRVGYKRCECVSKKAEICQTGVLGAGQLLKQVHTVGKETHDQSAILLVYRILLSKLDADPSGYPECDQKMRTDLILDNDIPDVLRNFAYRMRVYVILLVPSCTGSLQNGLQLVLDFFESPVVVLTEAPARSVWTKRTRIESSSF